MLAVMLLSYPLQQAIQSWSEVIMEQDKDEQLILNKLTDPQMVIIWNYCSGFQIITIHKHIFLESWQLFLQHTLFLLIEVERRNQNFISTFFTLVFVDMNLILIHQVLVALVTVFTLVFLLIRFFPCY